MQSNDSMNTKSHDGLAPIAEIARKIGILDNELELYGKFKAKINHDLLNRMKEKPCGKLILVSAMTPTPAGEGKTTVSIGLADALTRLGKRTIATLRQPSMGPVFGKKGGATGGGSAQVMPMEDINLHFTGDMHAVGAANNLLAAMTDNHIHHGNPLGIDPGSITWRRCIDMNDRQLRSALNGFDITAASEVMAILCLSRNIDHLKENLGKIIVGYDTLGNPVTAGHLKAEGAMAALLKDALKPNLVQTLEHTPVFIHGGPFANIAHGCNSIIATHMALKLADYVVTEAGFGADLGGEKFFDIKCRVAGLKPSAVVIVATVRALKIHGGARKDSLSVEDLGAVVKGIANLFKHVSNIKDKFGLPAVVAINRFAADTPAELRLVEDLCRQNGVNAAISEVWSDGGIGGIKLAGEILRFTDNDDTYNDDIGSKAQFRFLYDQELPLKEKIEVIVKEIYGGDGVDFLPEALNDLYRLQESGFGLLPVCMAKTQYSFSDDPKKLGKPEGFRISVRSVRLFAGAGFAVAITGEMMTMPGLPRVPAAENIDIDASGRITGLF